MAATYHTTHLGLSLWAQTDCPQWVDFLQDNQKLDQQVGGHIQDSALHLTAEDKQYLSQRSASVTYTGTGSGTQSVTLPFLPRKLTVLALSLIHICQLDNIAISSTAGFARIFSDAAQGVSYTVE